MRPLSNPFRLVDISALLGLGTDEAFRLLYLPRGIRDMIYHEILCDWGVQGPFRHELTDDQHETRLQVMTNKIETNILLVSKQVHEEAKQVFLKSNQFIHISMSARSPGLIAGAFLRSSKLAIVASGRENVARFKDLVVMKHEIGFPGDERQVRQHEIDIIMLRRDLSTFVKGFAFVDINSRRHVGHSRHEITIFNPFVKTPSPKFLNVKNLKRLLDPYVRRFQGFDDFQVRGEIDPDLAKSVVAMVSLEPPLPSPPSKILDRVVALKSRGEKSFLEKDYITALLYWAAAMNYLLSMRNRKAWPRLMETAEKDFTDHLSDMAFHVESGRARACVHIVEEGLEDGDMSGNLMLWRLTVSSACLDALEMGKILGTDWIPSDDQIATVCYYWAKGHRVTDGNVHKAEDYIRRADELRPDDEEIGSEMEKIVEWKHSMGLP